MKTPSMIITTILLALGFPALPERAQAVVPPPDGGYPGFNTAEGQNALFSLTIGVANTAVGWGSLFSNTDGSFNTAVGAGTLLFNVGDQSGDGTQNTAIGTAALLFNATGFSNTATGTEALVNNTEGFNNTAIGAGALSNNTLGGGNTAIGAGALSNNTTGEVNIALGPNAGFNITTASNVICIGAFGANVDDSCFIGNIWLQPGGTQAVYVSATGKLGQLVSSRRFKDNIKPMEKASEIIYGLKPVRFRYKAEIEPSRPFSFGLIAEDVEKISPDLVTRDSDGEVSSVRYDQVNAMLLNEFLKEHRNVQELKAIVAEQQKQIEALTGGLQKLSAQLGATKPAPQVAQND